MALSKIQSESINLADDFTFTGTVAGAGGITVADQWRLTASTSFVTDTYTNITANWERNDSTGFGYIGTGMTQSSGVFTFPSTSYANSLGIKTTINNSTYTIQTSTFTFGESKAPGVHNDSSSEFIFDVTSTANCKVMFAHFGTNGIVRGSTSENTTHVTFIRLGDT